MFTRRFTLLALATAAVVYGALVLLLGAAPVTALFTGLAAGALAGVVPSAIRDGRVPRLVRPDEAPQRSPASSS